MGLVLTDAPPSFRKGSSGGDTKTLPKYWEELLLAYGIWQGFLYIVHYAVVWDTSQGTYGENYFFLAHPYV